jgi:hypothetical protein
MSGRNSIILLWSLPIAISLHVFEEFAFPGGLNRWIAVYKPGRPKNNFYYFIVNAAAIVATFILASRVSGVTGIRIYLGFVAVMAANAASHIRGTIQAKKYCPGTVSGGLLLIPLFLISWWYFLDAGTLDLANAILDLGIGVFLGFYVMGMDIRKDGS